MKHKIFTITTGLCLLLLALLCLSGCGTLSKAGNSSSEKEDRSDGVMITDHHDGSFSCDLFAMDTVMQLKAYGGREAEKALSEASEEIMHLDRELDVTDKTSSAYALNHRETDTINGDAAKLLEESLRMAALTGGAFDPTVYPVVSAWGFTTQQYRVPEASEIEELLTHVGYGKVSVTKEPAGLSVRFDDARTEIDTGGIGKGYASENIRRILEENGVKSAIVSLGGNVMALGKKPDGSQWKVAVENPFNSSGTDYAGVIRLADRYAITSGGYQRFFEQDGKTYIHIMDPSTGQPVDNNLASVTILSDSGTEADALSTALYVMGLDTAVDFWKTTDLQFDMILITSDREIYVTDSIVKDFSTENKNDRNIHRISR